MRSPIVLILVLLSACGGAGAEPAPVDPPDAMNEQPAPDALYCPPREHPRVHYLSQEHNACVGMVLRCSIDQYGFDNQCGCGCIDKGDAICPMVFDDAIAWISIDPAECDGLPNCPLGDTPFDNSCGCGCTTH